MNQLLDYQKALGNHWAKLFIRARDWDKQTQASNQRARDCAAYYLLLLCDFEQVSKVCQRQTRAVKIQVWRDMAEGRSLPTYTDEQRARDVKIAGYEEAFQGRYAEDD